MKTSLVRFTDSKVEIINAVIDDLTYVTPALFIHGTSSELVIVDS